MAQEGSSSKLSAALAEFISRDFVDAGLNALSDEDKLVFLELADIGCRSVFNISLAAIQESARRLDSPFKPCFEFDMAKLGAIVLARDGALPDENS